MKNLEPIIAVWKPSGITSHDVIHHLRRLTGEKTIGHAGTLDPFASGVLVVGIGREGTKKLSSDEYDTKEYRAEVTLGTTSATDDPEGEKTPRTIAHPPTSEDIELALANFIGDIIQTPPAYSAVKVSGKPLYEYARKGKRVVLPKRVVTIHEIHILAYHFPILSLRVVTGGGTYIRSLAHDIGEQLKTGAYLSALTRTRVGPFTKKEASTLEQLEQ